MVKNTASRDETLADALSGHLRRLGNRLATLQGGWLDATTIQDLEELGVLGTLTSDQQQRLRLLIAELWEVEAVVPWTLTHRQKRTRWAKHGAGYFRQIERRSKAAVAAIEELRQYLRSIGVRRSPPYPFDVALANAIAVLDLQAVHAVAAHFKVPSGSKETHTDVMRRLYDFFVSDCGLRNTGDAEIRVGKIGNHYWDWNVEVVESVGRRRVPVRKVNSAGYGSRRLMSERTISDDKRRGCEAVRKAVNRRRRTQPLVDTHRTDR